MERRELMRIARTRLTAVALATPRLFCSGGRVGNPLMIPTHVSGNFAGSAGGLGAGTLFGQRTRRLFFKRRNDREEITFRDIDRSRAGLENWAGPMCDLVHRLGATA
jgi:hypothetical protein